MFTGHVESTIDAKGRVVLPSKYRNEIDFERDGRELYVSPDPDGCLIITPSSGWEKHLESIADRIYGPEKVRRFRRYLVANTEKTKCDKHGRLPLHPRLLKEAGIGREIVLAGNIDVIEVWSKEAWAKRQEEGRDNFRSDVESLS